MFEMYFEEIVKGIMTGKFSSIADVEDWYCIELTEEEIHKINEALGC